MSTQLCQRCQELPVTHKARGLLQRCPLCAQQLVKAGARCYRLHDSSSAVRSGRWRSIGPMMLGGLAALLLGGTLIASICFATLRTMEHGRLINSGRLSVPAADWSMFSNQPQTPVAQPAITDRYATRNVQVSRAAQPHAGVEQRRQRRDAHASALATAPYRADPVRIQLKPYADYELNAMLKDVPEVGLVQQTVRRTGEMEDKQIQEAHRSELRKLLEQKDALVANLIQSAGPLAGLPYRLGKDCQISKDQAARLEETSLSLRRLLASVNSTGSRYPGSHGAADLVQHLTRGSRLSLADAVPAFHQILSGESSAHRLSLVDVLKTIDSPQATQALVNRAVYDPSEEVRERAVTALKDKKPETMTEPLVAALHYPFGPVAVNAARTLVALNLKSVLPEVAQLLDAPEVGEPVRKAVHGRETYVRRELVRVNHLRNCLLCHAPAERAGRSSGQVLGLAPLQGSALPPQLSQVYYDQNRDGILVRADITYLRQDFSALQYVSQAAPWPEWQRFDFVVREQELTCADLDEWQQQTREHAGLSENRRAVLFVLQSLTGENFGNDARAWQAFVRR